MNIKRHTITFICTAAAGLTALATINANPVSAQTEPETKTTFSESVLHSTSHTQSPNKVQPQQPSDMSEMKEKCKKKMANPSTGTEKKPGHEQQNQPQAQKAKCPMCAEMKAAEEKHQQHQQNNTQPTGDRS